MKIISNQIECLSCGDTPFSAHRHDMTYCECGKVAADGGMSYLKRNGSDYQEMSVVIDEKAYHGISDTLKWCDENKRNNLGRICAIGRYLRDVGYEIKEIENE